MNLQNLDTTDDTPKPLDDLLEPGSTVMVATRSTGDSVESRPLTIARVDDDELAILVDSSADWTHAVNDGDLVHVTFSDTRSNTWLAANGRATMTQDPALIDELWSPFAGAYFDEGRDTPGITVLLIDVDGGEYWSTPSGRLGSVISMVKAKFAGSDASGDHGDIAV